MTTATCDEVTPEVDERPEDENRSVAFQSEVRSDTAAGVVFEGYAAVFNLETEVRDWRGQYLESVEPGAFRKTLQERKPQLLYEHGRHPLISTMQIGTLTKTSEDSRGLHVQGVMFNNIWTAGLIDAMRSGDLRGMSYNFVPVSESWSKDRSRRSIKELKLAINGDIRGAELSITSLPVQPASQISLRSIMALAELAERDDEVRAAWEAARSGTSQPQPEPPPVGHSVPKETLALYARALSRRFPAA